MSANSGRKKQSTVRKYFTFHAISNKKSKCNICYKDLMGDNSTNLKLISKLRTNLNMMKL